MHENGIVLEHLQHRQRCGGVAEFGLAQKRRDAQSVSTARFLHVHASHKLVDDDVRERTRKGIADLLRPDAADFRHGLARKNLIQGVLNARKFVGGDFVGEFDMAIEHLAVVGDHDHQSTVRRERNERDLLDRRGEQRRREHDGEAIGQAGQRRRRLVHQIIHLRSRIAQLVKRIALGFVAKFPLEKIVHEGAVPRVGGNAAGRSMGRCQIPLVLEHRKLVSHRSRGNAKAVAIDKRARTDRLRIDDVVLDKGLEHLLSTIGQHEMSDLLHTLRRNDAH